MVEIRHVDPDESLGQKPYSYVIPPKSVSHGSEHSFRSIGASTKVLIDFVRPTRGLSKSDCRAKGPLPQGSCSR